MHFIDSHAHITSDALYPYVKEILQRGQEANVSAIVNICTDVTTLERGLELASLYPWVYNAAATTPHDVEKEGELYFESMAAAAISGKLVAVGETGLDYHYHHSPKETQKEFLRRYLTLALSCKLPVIIHCRDAFEDFFSILDTDYVINGKHAPGVLHCFTGSIKEADQVVERGWFLSLSGIVTFKKSEELREVAKRVPLEHLLIETDSPYLAPQKYRGKVNEPAFIQNTAEVIAQIKEVPVENVASITANNARRLFSLPF